jgi:hypothetical protein
MPSEGEYYSVRYFTNTLENPTVPLMFKAGIDGDYTIRCNFNADEFETIMLEDCQRHYIHNIKTTPEYTFKSLRTDDANRFVLHFGPDNTAHYNELPARIFTDGTQVIIDLTLVGPQTEVLVYDATGRLLLYKSIQGSMQHTLNLSVQPQILIVHLRNQQGVISRKLFFNHKY